MFWGIIASINPQNSFFFAVLGNYRKNTLCYGFSERLFYMDCVTLRRLIFNCMNKRIFTFLMVSILAGLLCTSCKDDEEALASKIGVLSGDDAEANVRVKDVRLTQFVFVHGLHDC